MTRLRSIAEAMKTRLEEIEELAGKVVVFRKYDIESEFDKRMAKTRGKAVIVRLLGAKNVQKKQSSFYTGTFSVTLFTAPLLTQKDVMDSDDLMTAIEAKLQGWWPTAVASNNVMWLQCDGVSYPEDPNYDVSLLTVQAPGNFN